MYLYSIPETTLIIYAIPIDGCARLLGMEFGVGDLSLRYDFFLILLEQTNYSYLFLKENHNAHPKTKSTWDR